MEEKELRRYSRVVVDGVEQAPSRAMLRAVGFEEEDFSKPQIGIASTWSMITPCNMHVGDLAKLAAEGADAAGGKGVIFNTMTVSDGISMGTSGMRYSLVSRELIADSIEAVAGAQGFDGIIAIGGCDKNMPACVMAMARLNRPAVFVYGGTIKPGAERRDIVSVFEAVGAHAGGAVSDAELLFPRIGALVSSIAYGREDGREDDPEDRSADAERPPLDPHGPRHPAYARRTGAARRVARRAGCDRRCARPRKSVRARWRAATA